MTKQDLVAALLFAVAAIVLVGNLVRRYLWSRANDHAYAPRAIGSAPAVTMVITAVDHATPQLERLAASLHQVALDYEGLADEDDAASWTRELVAVGDWTEDDPEPEPEEQIESEPVVGLCEAERYGVAPELTQEERAYLAPIFADLDRFLTQEFADLQATYGPIIDAWKRESDGTLELTIVHEYLDRELVNT